MEEQQQTKRTGIIIIELLIFVAVLVLCIVVSLGLFAQADAMGRESQVNELVLSGTQTAAECFKAAAGDLDRAASLCGGTVDQGVLTMEVGENVRVVMTVESAGSPRIGTLTAYRDAEELLRWQIAALEVSP